MLSAAIAAGLAGALLFGGPDVLRQVRLTAVIVGLAVLVWLGVVLVDLLARQQLDPSALVSRDRQGPYFYTAGFHLPGLLAWLTGMAAAALFVEIPVDNGADLTGPLADSLVGDYGLGWLIAFTVGAGAYAAFGGTQVERRRILRQHRQRREYRAEQHRLRMEAKQQPTESGAKSDDVG